MGADTSGVVHNLSFKLRVTQLAGYHVKYIGTTYYLIVTIIIIY